MLAQSEKDYKRTLDKTQRKYRQNLCRRLKNMRTKDPKEFWKILNQGKRKTQPNISLQKLFEFFKNLNTAPSDDIGADLPNLNVEELNQLNYELRINKLSEYLFNRSVNTAVKSLPRQLTIVIGRQFLGSLLSPLFL
jgi:hypothetical protein